MKPRLGLRCQEGFDGVHVQGHSFPTPWSNRSTTGRTLGIKGILPVDRRGCPMWKGNGWCNEGIERVRLMTLVARDIAIHFNASGRAESPELWASYIRRVVNVQQPAACDPDKWEGTTESMDYTLCVRLMWPQSLSNFYSGKQNKPTRIAASVINVNRA